MEGLEALQQRIDQGIYANKLSELMARSKGPIVFKIQRPKQEKPTTVCAISIHSELIPHDLLPKKKLKMTPDVLYIMDGEYFTPRAININSLIIEPIN